MASMQAVSQEAASVTSPDDRSFGVQVPTAPSVMQVEPMDPSNVFAWTAAKSIERT